MIDTITFDLWNTLISNTPEDALKFKEARSRGIIEAFLSYGIKMEKKKVEKALDLTFKRCWDLWERNLDFGTEDQIKILMEFLPDFDVISSSGLLKRIEKAYTESVLESPSDLVKGSSESPLPELTKSSVLLNLLSSSSAASYMFFPGKPGSSGVKITLFRQPIWLIAI